MCLALSYAAAQMAFASSAFHFLGSIYFAVSGGIAAELR